MTQEDDKTTRNTFVHLLKREWEQRPTLGLFDLLGNVEIKIVSGLAERV